MVKRGLIKKILSEASPEIDHKRFDNLPKFCEENLYIYSEDVPERYEKAKRTFAGLKENKFLQKILIYYDLDKKEFDYGKYKERECYVCGHKKFLRRADLCYECSEVYDKIVSNKKN